MEAARDVNMTSRVASNGQWFSVYTLSSPCSSDQLKSARDGGRSASSLPIESFSLNLSLKTPAIASFRCN